MKNPPLGYKKGVSATLWSGRYTLSYPRRRYNNERPSLRGVWWECHSPARRQTPSAEPLAISWWHVKRGWMVQQMGSVHLRPLSLFIFTWPGHRLHPALKQMSIDTGREYWSRDNIMLSLPNFIASLFCKAKRQYLLWPTYKVYCILALNGSILLCNGLLFKQLIPVWLCSSEMCEWFQHLTEDYDLCAVCQYDICKEADTDFWLCMAVLIL